MREPDIARREKKLGYSARIGNIARREKNRGCSARIGIIARGAKTNCAIFGISIF